VFGNHFELLEMCELHALRKAVIPLEIEAELEEFHCEFDVSQECSKAELKYAAQTSCAIDAMITKHRLGSLAYYYEGQPGNPYETQSLQGIRFSQSSISPWLENVILKTSRR